MTDKDREILAKMQVLLDAAQAKAKSCAYDLPDEEVRDWCFSALSRYFWPLTQELSDKAEVISIHHSNDVKQEVKMKAFMFAYTDTSWLEEVLKEVGLGTV